jgi:hypothetical protein
VILRWPKRNLADLISGSRITRLMLFVLLVLVLVLVL